MLLQDWDLKPALIHSKFFPSLLGPKTKMSASEPNTAIFLTDSPSEIKRKIQGAFSGGKDTKEEQEKYGANIEIDVAYQYLTFFLDDDVKLKQIGDDYQSGKMLTSQVKKILIDILVEKVNRHQRNREKVSEEILDAFLTPKKMNF